jgi:CIC family chloride channel protein
MLASNEIDGIPLVDSTGLLTGWLTPDAVLRTLTTTPWTG